MAYKTYLSRFALAFFGVGLVVALTACSAPAIPVPPTPSPNPSATVVLQNHQHGEASVSGGNARLVTRYGGDFEVAMRTSPLVPTPRQVYRLEYFLKDKNGAPVTVDQLRITHEHPMHLIVVSEDLRRFAHLHPRDKGSGRYVISDTLPSPGTYLAYNEFVTASGSTQIERDVITTTGSYTAAPAHLEPDLGVAQQVEGLTVTMTSTQGIRRKLPTRFAIRVEQDGKPVSDLEPYLGAACHVVIISQDTRQFAHTHGEVPGSSSPSAAGAGTAMDSGMMNMPPPPAHFGPELQFTHTFMQAGMYRIWVQFGWKGRTVTVAYNVQVGK